MTDKIITAKCIDKSFESRNAVQYLPNDVVRIIYRESDRQSFMDINLADKYQRRLVWLKSLGGRWAFEFDRASASDTSVRIFFCKECGQPFDKLSEIGTHSKEFHTKLKAHVDKTLAEDADAEEERLLAEKIAAEAAEDAKKAEVTT